jgi:outer membrane protein OmpA-like peptidoglycan-associated protein
MRSGAERRRYYSLSLTALSSCLCVRTLYAQVPQLAEEWEISGKKGGDPALYQGRPLASSGSDDSGAEGDYIHRYKPTAGLGELGLFVGPLFISDANSFRGPAVSNPGTFPTFQPISTFKQPAPEFGLRAAYFPLSFLGGELEGMVAAAENDSGNGVAVLAARAHVMLQSPFWSVVPFVLGGVGYWTVMNNESGNDTDPAFHYGGGVKVNVTSNIALRVDLRDTITNQRSGGNYPHNVEALAGANLVLGRQMPKDSDGDGLVDERDQCPLEAGALANGCPIRDSDADGIPDLDDQCVRVPGLAPTGCPVLDADQDGINDASDQCVNEKGGLPTGCPDGDLDGVLDINDKCPAVPGVAPDGCLVDADGDGLIGASDLCPDKAETKNGFEDADGCPDEIPDAIKNFMGVIAGIEFDNGKDVIRAASDPALDRALSVLKEYPSLRVQVIGFTDDRGKRDYNMDLSQRRAEAVKSHLISRGIDPQRIESRGSGPDQPIAPNDSASGRQKNRRIEFKIIE